MRTAWWGRALALAVAALLSTSAEGATVTGTVTVVSAPPAAVASLTHDRHVCGQAGTVYSSTTAVDPSGGVAGVIVYIEPRAPTAADALPRPPVLTGKSAKRAKAPRALIDQVNCQFVPRARAIGLGTEVWVRSSDPVLHNVHFRRPDRSTVTSVSTPIADTEVHAFTATEPGRISVECDAGHHWMRADLIVLDHTAYGETDARGRFRIAELPVGTWWLIAWHPVLGERRVPVEILAPDARVALAFRLGPGEDARR